MKRMLKIGAAVVAALAVLAAGTLGLGVYLGERKAQRVVRLDVPGLPALGQPATAATVERGRYLYLSRGCTECHGVDGAGREFVNDGKGLVLQAPNITPGPGSSVAAYRPEDWVRTIRHGVKPDGRPAMIMPSEDYNRLTDVDLAAMVAYLRQMPPAEGRPAVISLPLPVKALYGFHVLKDAAQKIDHRLPPQQPVTEGRTVEHGAYVAQMCIGCHGASLAGGKIPGAPPDWPPAANLTGVEGGGMSAYASIERFTGMMRSGKRPDGTPVSPVMPFLALKELNDTDVGALHLYLRSLPGLN